LRLESTAIPSVCRQLPVADEVLAPRSLVVIGARRRWWPTGEGWLARKLRREGHEVVLAEVEG